MKGKIMESIKAVCQFLLLLLMLYGLYSCVSSPESWLVEHDRQCEIMLKGGDFAKDTCGCYKRQIEADRKRREE